MQQLNLPDEMKVPVNFNSADLLNSVRVLRPLVYKDGDSVCVVLGPDPQEGVFGCGPTTEVALKDWDTHLKERISSHKEGDDVAGYILEKLKGSSDII